MPKFIDLTGRTFGRFLVLSHVGLGSSKKHLYLCKCVCGVEKIVRGAELSRGKTVSCGCYLKERITRHGGSKNSSYYPWRGMMRRCYNPVDKDYCKYGAVGINVQENWHEYENFVLDMGEPFGDQTLDRQDPYGNYTIDNCRWATVMEQNRNRRLSPKNKSGYTGVGPVYGGKWMAYISVKRKKFYSKVFDTIEEAVDARKQLEEIYWGSS